MVDLGFQVLKPDYSYPIIKDSAKIRYWFNCEYGEKLLLHFEKTKCFKYCMSVMRISADYDYKRL